MRESVLGRLTISSSRNPSIEEFSNQRIQGSINSKVAQISKSSTIYSYKDVRIHLIQESNTLDDSICIGDRFK